MIDERDDTDPDESQAPQRRALPEALAPALKEMTALEELDLYSEFVIVWVVVIEGV